MALEENIRVCESCNEIAMKSVENPRQQDDSDSDENTGQNPKKRANSLTEEKDNLCSHPYFKTNLVYRLPEDAQ